MATFFFFTYLWPVYRMYQLHAIFSLLVNGVNISISSLNIQLNTRYTHFFPQCQEQEVGISSVETQ